MAKVSQTIKRPLSQDEVDVFAYWSANSIAIGVNGIPFGATAGLWRAYRTRHTYRFPLWQPRPDKFQPFEFPPRFPIVRGQLAAISWHSLRTSAYVFLGAFVGGMLFTNYGLTVSSVGQAKDPRMKNFLNDVKELRKHQAKDLQQHMDKRKAPPTNPQKTDSDSPQSTGWSQDGTEGDDASPSSWAAAENTESSAYKSSSTLRGNGGAEAEEARQRYTRSSPFPPQTPPENTDMLSDVLGDSPPTDGTFTNAAGTVPQQQGSAWERVRRQAGSFPNKQQTYPGGPRAESTASSWPKKENNTEDGQLGTSDDTSKSEAQKEFDARVERERKGGNFETGNGDQKRW